MNTANKITVARFVITPLFFLAFYFFVYLPGLPASWTGTVILWVLFIVSELSDLADGYIARRFNQVTDLGKLMDPFADVIFRVTYFVCFAAMNWIPWWAVMIILWREYTIMFIRMLLIKEGTALAARFWGKFKAFCYFITGIIGMAMLTLHRISDSLFQSGILTIGVFAVLSALFALISLVNYLRLFVLRNRA